MLGAIAGDIIGSVYEWAPLKEHWRDFILFSPKSRFTDDTVLSLAVARGLVESDGNGDLFAKNLPTHFHSFVLDYPKAGYGSKFIRWSLNREKEPYNSFGNGSAMRVSPVAWAWNTLEDVEKHAEISAAVTHNHPEGIKGACAVAGCIFLARTGKSQQEIRDYASGKYGYNLDRPVEKIREDYKFNSSCQGSVPEALSAFLESDSFEEAVRKAVWLGGDADTQAAIAGSVAEAYYKGVPEDIARQSFARLDNKLQSGFLEWQKWLNRSREG